MAAQTLFGSAKMLLETGMHPGQFEDHDRISPGGTGASPACSPWSTAVFAPL